MATSDYEGRDLESMAFAERYHALITDIFKPYLGNRVVEVGAGNGSMTTLIASADVDAIVAVEPSASMFPLLDVTASSLEGRVTAVHGFLQDAAEFLDTYRPDTFVYVNVLEHIEDDSHELAQVFDLLSPGGHLCLFVPAMPSLFSEFDRSIGHYRRYRLGPLRQQLQQLGFELNLARYFDWLGILPWLLRFRLLKSRRLSPSTVRSYDRVGVPIIRASESVFSPPLGKNIIAVARKPKTD